MAQLTVCDNCNKPDVEFMKPDDLDYSKEFKVPRVNVKVVFGPMEDENERELCAECRKKIISKALYDAREPFVEHRSPKAPKTAGAE